MVISRPLGELFAITDAHVIDPASGLDDVRTVLIRDGKIEGFTQGEAPKSATLILYGKGLWLTPGFVDLHAHLREPGQEYKETIETGAKAAAAGGFTTIVAMPNTKPAIDNAALVRFVSRKSDEAKSIRVLPSAAVTIGQNGEQITEFADVCEAGAVCLTDDGKPIVSAGIMRRALEYATIVDLPIMVHEEEPTLSGGSMHEGDVSLRLGLKGIPFAAEDAMVWRDIVLAELTGGRLHIGHISTAGSVEAVRHAKARGIRVTAEVTPHHFSLNHTAVGQYDTNAKMAPPLRTEQDRLAIIEGMKDGTIDAIATDHAPHALVDKEVEFDHAMNGIVGLETAFGLTMKLVQSGALSRMRAIELLTSGPAKAYSLDAGTLKVGARADFALIDPEKQWTVRPEKFISKGRNTPFGGWEMRGLVLKTFVDGRMVFMAA